MPAVELGDVADHRLVDRGEMAVVEERDHRLAAVLAGGDDAPRRAEEVAHGGEAVRGEAGQELVGAPDVVGSVGAGDAADQLGGASAAFGDELGREVGRRAGPGGSGPGRTAPRG